MSANNKWDVNTTIKFIQLYKLHPCLWNFQSPEYKIKQKRDEAINSIVHEMDITGFGTQEVKNKIKNLRSTYQQEYKKIEESKKAGAGFSNVYTSNIKWLKEMEEVFSKDLNKNINKNNRRPTDEDTASQDSIYATSPHSNSHLEIPITATSTITSGTTTISGNNARAKKRTRENFQSYSDLKKLNEAVDSENETVFDVFGRSVALQLKNLSAENALLAQNKIQNILTEYGIKELRQRASYSSSSNQSYQTPSSVYSDTTTAVYLDTSNVFHTDCYHFDETFAKKEEEDI